MKEESIEVVKLAGELGELITRLVNSTLTHYPSPIEESSFLCRW
jgi:hypothetical protein